jgi:mono/diheme cytochrome c family protein
MSPLRYISRLHELPRNASRFSHLPQSINFFRMLRTILIRHVIAGGCFAGIAASFPAFPARGQLAAPPLPDLPAKNAPGLTLTFSAGDKTDSRRARLIALYVPANQSPTPFLPPGPFVARWEGNIHAALRSEFTFAADVKGSFKLTINGKAVLEGAGDTTSQTMNKTFQLNKGANPIVAEFMSDGASDAMLRLNWWSSEFPAEPIPPTAFTHASSANALRTGMRLRDGRMLFAELRCAACHADSALPARNEGMPEFSHDAPVFDELGGKFNETWLAHWINDPHSIRPHALMPRIFHANAPAIVDPRAADIAAYLVSVGKPDDTAPAVENAPLGGALFANLGCIACHTTPEVSGADENGRVPLAHLKAKWQPPALREYLKNPSKNYAWTHMPNFRLTNEEAERLTAFLFSGTQREFPPVAKGDAAKGAQLLVSAGCLNCHAGMPPTTQPTLAATLEKGWTTGCMANEDASRGNAPDFQLDGRQRDALRAFAAAGFHSLKTDSAVEFAERQFENMRCAACHARDGEPPLWSKLEGEMAPLTAGAPTQPEANEAPPIPGSGAPMSTWLGEKLRPEWMSNFISGNVSYKPRPWLIARMPGFATVANGLAKGLSFEHGFSATIDPEPAVDAEKAKIGEILLGENGGFNCTTCHAVGDRPATAVFEAPGVNFAYAHERLRWEYYRRWVMHPLRIDPETKMPKFADDEGKTPLTQYYEGDARKQFDAIWEFLRTLKK